MSLKHIVKLLILYVTVCELCDGNVPPGQQRMTLSCVQGSPLDTNSRNHVIGRMVKSGPRGYKGERGRMGDSVKGDVGSKGEKGARGRGKKGEPGQCPDVTSLQQELASLKKHLTHLISPGFAQETWFPKDCSDIKLNKTDSTTGVYQIYPHGTNNSKSVSVMCDMDCAQEGWTVFQRRINGSVDFYKNWQHYVDGFGSPHGEYWLGLESLYRLTNNHDMMLRVDLEDRDGNRAYAQYASFRLAGADANYRLSVGGYTGTAGDSLTPGNHAGYLDGMEFSTQDRDNDKNSESCATNAHGAWWYNSCHLSNLNGDYSVESAWSAVIWYHWHRDWVGMKSTKMMIKRI